MTLFAERSYSRVMVFIDFRNVSESLQILGDGVRLDLYRLTQILVGSRDLVGAYVFDATRRFVRKDDEIVGIHNRLRDQGFRLVVSDSMRYNEESGKTVQKEVDVSMACEMVEHALMDHYDVAIVVSGDMDFVPAIKKVQAAGKRVELAAYGETCSEDSKRAADLYYLLDDLPFMSMSTPTVEAGQ